MFMFMTYDRKCHFNSFNANQTHYYFSDVTFKENTKSLFFQSSHIHLIDALMMAYIVEMISIEKVVSSVKRFSNFSASKELPFDLEDAMVFWINKVRTQHFYKCLCIRVSVLTCGIYATAGEHKDEGDHGKRAENEAPSAGVTQSPEGNSPCVCLFYSVVSQSLQLSICLSL